MCPRQPCPERCRAIPPPPSLALTPPQPLHLHHVSSPHQARSAATPDKSSSLRMRTETGIVAMQGIQTCSQALLPSGDVRVICPPVGAATSGLGSSVAAAAPASAGATVSAGASAESAASPSFLAGAGAERGLMRPSAMMSVSCSTCIVSGAFQIMDHTPTIRPPTLLQSVADLSLVLYIPVIGQWGAPGSGGCGQGARRG